MTELHSPAHPPPGVLENGAGIFGETAVVLLWVVLGAGYLVAGRRAALRGREGWPRVRTTAWLAGVGLGLVATAAPSVFDAAGSFTAHTAVHLALGMFVPLLLVLGAPVTLLLRAVSVGSARRIVALLRAAPIRLIAHPPTAFLLTSAPMAALYWDGSALGLLHHPVVGPLLHVHFVASGALFAHAVVGLDPDPHRAAPWIRGAAIVASIAVHGVVAKHLYAVADGTGLPPGTEQAAQLMYYGGDAAHVLLLVVFCAQVQRRSGRARRRQTTARPRHLVEQPGRIGSLAGATDPVPPEGTPCPAR